MASLDQKREGQVSGAPCGVSLADVLRGNLQPLLEHLTVGVALTRRGTLVDLSWAFARLCAVARADELVGKPIGALWSDLGAGLPTPENETPVEVEIRRADGDWSRARVQCLPVRVDAEGEDQDAYRLWLADDITAASRREGELLQVHREQAAAHREVAELRARVQRESAEREQLLGVVSHELRTPLTVISGYSRLLLAGEVGELNEQQHAFLTECHRSCKRLEAFVGRLLSASRAAHGEGETELELEEASLESTIRDIVRLLRPLIDERGLRVEVVLDAEALRARFDPMRIEQVLTNLLGNAINYASDGGRVRIETRPVEVSGRRFVEVAVSDDGPGIPASERERVFEPYVRGPGGSNVGGLGLGLAICRQLVDAHGGTISVDEAPGGGCRFAFRLPATGRSVVSAGGH